MERLGTAQAWLDGHLALPATPGPGVLVVHDGFGLLPHVRRRCEDLAAAGFVAFAPDLYGGRSTLEPAVAETLAAGLGDDTLVALRAVAASLRAHPAVGPPSCAAVGYALGGRLALELATAERIDAVVTYYAVLAPERAAQVLCPVLALLAEVDGWEPPDAPARFTAALRLMGTAAEEVTYPGTVEGFANTDLPTGQPLAAERAWERTVNFLAAHLP